MEESASAVLEPQIEQIAIEYPLDNLKSKRRSLALQLLFDVVKSVTATVIIFMVLVTYVIQGFKVYGKCMEPNLATGQRLLGNKFVYRYSKPQRGDVVIFRYPRDPSKVYIKRVIGRPGETVQIRGGSLLVNGKAVKEPYIKNSFHGDYGPEKVQKGNLFVLGDNRDFSNDSRYWGQLPVEDIEAKAWFRYWPAKRMEIVR